MKNEKMFGVGWGVGLYHNNTHICTYGGKLCMYIGSNTLEQAASYFITKTCCRQRVSFFLLYDQDLSEYLKIIIIFSPSPPF